MKKLSSWLLTMFIIMFWILRLIVSFTYSMSIDFPIKPLNFNVEMILLFITFFAILLIIKRNLIGGIVFVVVNVYYFGTYAIDFINSSNTTVSTDTLTNLAMTTIALILSFGIILDLALNKDRHEGKDDKDTHWFYKNEKYDRKLDDRADKNQYRL